MSPHDIGITFEHIGIGSALKNYKLAVPPNQRPYAWEDAHVERLFEDLSAAILSDEPTYFLGTIVLAKGEGDRSLVADGQQRLATTSILIAAIRDYLYAAGVNERKAAEKYGATYLLEYEEFANDYTPKITLNTDDSEFFIRTVLVPPDDPSRDSLKAKAFSHTRLARATELAKGHVEKIVAELSQDKRAKRLYEWIAFLANSAVVVVIRVPGEIDAYRMFETLNDRGLRASQIDILKNYLFSEARDNVPEVEPRWASTIGIIESIGDDDLMLEYVRHFWITEHGPTVEDKLAEGFRESIKGKKQALGMAINLESSAGDYVALLTALEHPKCSSYGNEARAHLSGITSVLKIKQIRPLLLSIIRHFEPEEARRAFKMCLCWSVRFLVAGGGGGGVLDRHYGLRAQEIHNKVIKTASALREKMLPYIPPDSDFRDGFRRHQVSKSHLARYYLHAFEDHRNGESHPEIAYFEMPETSVNLEHVIPNKPSPDWPMTPAEAQTLYKRLGNMALLATKQNVELGNESFEVKRPVLSASPFALTQEIAAFLIWNESTIQERQDKMANVAPQIWPI